VRAGLDEEAAARLGEVVVVEDLVDGWVELAVVPHARFVGRRARI
jgi:hypothetical protein